MGKHQQDISNLLDGFQFHNVVLKQHLLELSPSILLPFLLTDGLSLYILLFQWTLHDISLRNFISGINLRMNISNKRKIPLRILSNLSWENKTLSSRNISFHPKNCLNFSSQLTYENQRAGRGSIQKKWLHFLLPYSSVKLLKLLEMWKAWNRNKA